MTANGSAAVSGGVDAPLDPARLPRHVAVIMDGNGRWARARGLPRLAGHRAGTEALRRLIEGCIEHGIPHLTIYAFSTENWMRPAHEVRGLMFLLEEVIERQLDELDASGVRLRHIGWLDGVPRHIADKIQEAVDRTSGNRRLTVNVAFNYGSRMEIIRAVRRIVEDGVQPTEIDHDRFEQYLETAGSPDPDLVIRTSGEMRLSNFLLWQVAYAEIYCTDTLWPDFDGDELLRALRNYACRERRFGARPMTDRNLRGDSRDAPGDAHEEAARAGDVEVRVADDRTAQARVDVASETSRDSGHDHSRPS